MRRNSLICVFVLALVLSWSASTSADFYVIPVSRAKRTVLVRPQSTQSASGTALLNALDAITDASATNPYLIIIEPGVFDIGSNSLVMKPYVDIQGAGENVTKITGNVSGIYSGVVQGADNAELRFLTVENTGGGTYAIAICNDNASPKMTNLTATASGGTSTNRAIYNYYSSAVMTYVTANSSGGFSNRAIYNHYSDVTMMNVTANSSGGTVSTAVYNYRPSVSTMTNVTATASGGLTDTQGVYNSNCSPTMMNVTATASAAGGSCRGVRNSSSTVVMINVTAAASGCTTNLGLYNDAGSSTVNVYNSRLSGSTNTVRILAGTTYVGASQLDGGAVLNSGTELKCVNSYDGSYDPLDASCN